MYLSMDEKKLKKEIAHAIKVFIEKRQVDTPEVEWPKEVFKFKGVKNVEINHESLKDYGVRWTFEGTAVLVKTDEKHTVQTKSIRKLIGSATMDIGQKQNDLWIIVKQVTITKIKES